MRIAVTIIQPSFADVEIRSYGEQRTSDQHAFAQLVLPVSGQVRLEIEGKEARLNPLHGAVVVAGAWHSQCSDVDNRSLIVDLDPAGIKHEAWDRLSDRPFTEISAAARKLVEFMQLSLDASPAQPALIRGWVPLLLDTLALETPQARSRLTALLAQVEAHPASPWTTESMARYASLSASRLHALFREELDTSPRAWLLQKRLQHACALLAHTRCSIADIALSTGFSDQTVLTRAMRQSFDTTPAAYRRASQESRQDLRQEPASKIQ